jgi:hypothetical protein
LKNLNVGTAAASDIALKLLGYMAESEELFGFMDQSGLDQQSLTSQATDPAFHAAVLDFVLSDETLLLAFAGNAGINPADILKHRSKLPGFSHE